MRKTNTFISTLLLPAVFLTGISETGARMNGIDGIDVAGRQATQLYFVENKGQVKDQHEIKRDDIDFRLTAASGLNMFVGNGMLHYQWTATAEDISTRTYRMDVTLVGANPNAEVDAVNQGGYSERYYQPDMAGVVAHSWQKIVYREIYPNIDWVLYTRNGILEYDFVVHPGGKVSDIRLRYDGAGSLKLNANGSITATTPMGTITENAPVSFAAGNKSIPSRFLLDQNILSFDVASYEGTLVIDPVLEWSTYYGGNGMDYGRCVATDNTGAVYMTGSAFNAGTNLATTGAHQGSYGGPASGVTYGDAFLVKFDMAGNRLWATYFGGTASEGGWGVVCDETNNVYLTGQTSSSSAISGGTNIFQNTYGGGSSDAFLAKFDSSGAFVWSTYYGGSDMDEGWGVASDKQGHIYLAGKTTSSSGISSGTTVHQPAIGGGQDGFLVKFDTAGNRQWATYFGGNGADHTWTAKCDNTGNVYISGETGSTNNIATTTGHQTTMTPSNGSEAFLIKFAPDGSKLWGTYYGGDQPGQTFGTGIAIDDSNAVYLSGYTTSTVDIATPGSHQPTLVAGYTSFLVKFDTTGDRVWGTYYGGTGLENGYGATSDPWGNIYITGYTTSPDNIATSGAIQQSLEGAQDIYVAKFNREGVRLWGTYYGGAGYDAGISVAADRYGSVYVTGFTNGGGISTTNAFQPNLGGGFDGFLLRLSECTAVENPEIIGGADSLCAGTSAMYGITPIPGAHSYTWILPSGWLGNSTNDSILATAGNTSGIISVVANGTCNTSDTITKEVGVYPEPIIDVMVDGIVLSTIQQFVSYQWYMNNLMITGATDSTYDVIENGIYSVRVVDQHGCSHISRPYAVNNVSVDEYSTAGTQVKIYPNPAQDILYVHAAKPVQTVIRSIDGRVVVRHENVNQINISELSEGIYILQITDEKGQLLLTERLVKAGR